MCDRKREQLDRFKEAAREVEADTSDDALDLIMGELDMKKKPEAHHASDCATHNAPALPAGKCDCGL